MRPKQWILVCGLLALGAGGYLLRRSAPVEGTRSPAKAEAGSWPCGDPVTLDEAIESSLADDCGEVTGQLTVECDIGLSRNAACRHGHARRQKDETLCPKDGFYEQCLQDVSRLQGSIQPCLKVSFDGDKAACILAVAKAEGDPRLCEALRGLRVDPAWNRDEAACLAQVRSGPGR
jgi:hypothetical protein